ncbi:chondroitin AC/alginate lyase [Kockovaella imperatae]|uniref:Chondroitin AC/alginate lyase n=1 Tax=Kockovaella imperatae TaxID=4999 RepID=A0A1Y1UEL7_9TREE|nr:chondroitin AC/alginate lyase [Kockovaella imperatae]ORX35954.1 chondroitin AC/alginate lyase [Kockovaella imperatae]
MTFRQNASSNNPYATMDMRDSTQSSRQQLTDPMSSQNPYAATGSRGYNEKPRSSKKKWWWIGGILALLIIIGGVLGGVLGTQLNDDDKKDGSHSSSGGNNNDNSNGSGVPGNTGLPSGLTSANTAAMTETGANGQVYLAIATDSEWMLPLYATGTNTAGYSEPTVLANPSPESAWPADPNPPSNDSIRDHPRLIAPAYKWEALTTGGLIANDPYLSFWNETIVGNASDTLNDDPVPYTPDGGLTGSGVLDVARKMKLRVKNWAYAYKVTNETKYAERVWLEIWTAAGNNSAVPFGANGTRWNAQHFLDLAEFCATYAIAYDWLYDYWTDEQRDSMMWTMLDLGLSFGVHALNPNDTTEYGWEWWTGPPKNSQEINGNWNCVCNGGLTMAALAIIDRDPTGMAQQILDMAIPNAYNGCFQAPHDDGTWSETANYWYFGTSAAGEFVSSLLTAYGNDRGMAASNPGWALTPLYHMYVQGQTSLFNYGDCGPNKYSTTANSLMLWATMFQEPIYALYQRDHFDAPEPWSMFWYDPALDGTWWDQLPLDHFFPSELGAWASARSSWTDLTGSYWAIKSGDLRGHQTHGDLDLGDFVIDALGTRWFGELGSGQYLSTGYFSSSDQESERWTYYRKRTEGQNTILIDYLNQNVNAAPTQNWGSSNTSQGAAPSFSIPNDSTAYFTMDMSTAYNSSSSVKRGIRYFNSRKQILIQDEITGVPSGTDIQWRANTNATVTTNGGTATLVLDGQTAIATIVQGPSGAAFSTASPVPFSTDPPMPASDGYAGDPGNPGVTVLVVDQPNGGDLNLTIAINPQWPGMQSSDYLTPPNVPLDEWSLTSHNGA